MGRFYRIMCIYLLKKGHGDHAVIGIFAVMSVAGAAAAIAFLIYSGKFFI